LKTLFVLTVMLMFALVCQADPEGGGSTSVGDGGHGVLCDTYPDSHETVYQYTLDLYDFFEARNLAKKNGEKNYWKWPKEEIRTNFDRSDTSNLVCAELKHRKNSLKEILGKGHPLLKVFDEACALSSSLYWKDSVPLSNDLGAQTLPLPKYCRLVQIGYHTYVHGIEQVWIDENLSFYLPIRVLAALLYHERLHHYFRAETSTHAVRKTVAYVFANHEYQKQFHEDFLVLLSRVGPLNPVSQRFLVMKSTQVLRK
jgi:hypothetical protein